MIIYIFFQDLDSKTTHLVAIQPGTAKVHAAKKYNKIKIVNSDWLWSCAERWELVDERLYPLSLKVNFKNFKLKKKYEKATVEY